MVAERSNLKICFMGGRHAGIVSALTVLSKGNDILSAVGYSTDFTEILGLFSIPVYKSINDKGFVQKLSESDILLCVHGREIVNPDLFKLPRFGSINIHPYLYKYKGANPVERAVKDKNFKASVGAHIIDERVDGGRVLVEEFVDVSGANGVEEIYNRLYMYYSIVTLRALEVICYEQKR